MSFKTKDAQIIYEQAKRIRQILYQLDDANTELSSLVENAPIAEIDEWKALVSDLDSVISRLLDKHDELDYEQYIEPEMEEPTPYTQHRFFRDPIV